MNEWKELQIDNLPPDILTGGYEWQVWRDDLACWYIGDLSFKNIVRGEKYKLFNYRYRKPEPKTPSHEGIQISNEAKDRITGNLFYLFHQFMTQEPLTKAIDIQHRLNLTRDAITNVLESATIPPEEKS